MLLSPIVFAGGWNTFAASAIASEMIWSLTGRGDSLVRMIAAPTLQHERHKPGRVALGLLWGACFASDAAWATFGWGLVLLTMAEEVRHQARYVLRNRLA